MSISSWETAYCRLWSEAAQSRGTRTMVIHPEDPTRYSTIRDWPMTTGADVLAIAALVDSVLGPMPEHPGCLGVRLLWQTAVVELATSYNDPAAEYLHNQAFWSTLLAAAAYLDTMDAPLPSEDAWETLFTVLWSPAAQHRNGDEPSTRTIIESDFEKMWASQHTKMLEARGFDVREPLPGGVGRPMKIPRTTNAEAIPLFEYWSGQFYKFMTRAALGGVVNTQGLTGQRERWNAVTRDIDNLAKAGKPQDVYAKNHELWRESHTLAINLAAWGEEPTPFELLADSTVQAVKDLPDRVAAAAGAVSHVIGNVAHEIGAGVLSAVGKPLLIGGGVVLGTILLLRITRSRASA